MLAYRFLYMGVYCNLWKSTIIFKFSLSLLSVTAYLSETADLFFKRSAYDQMDEFLKYRIYKRNVSKEIITLGKPEDGNEFCGNVSALFICCQERYSLRYVNKTHVSFQMSNVKPKDCGLYFRQAYFRGVERDPEYETINFTAKGNVFYE